MPIKPKRSGIYLRQRGGYDAFLPDPLPPANFHITQKVARLLSEADQAVGHLDGIVELVPSIDLFVAMYERREAVYSSQIEGTRASLMDVLEFEARAEKGPSGLDIKEVLNYTAAMRYGMRRLESLPLSLRLLREVHARLMKGVRGGEPHKTPGEFRRSQNWIGGGSPVTARFVPPPADKVMDCMSHLEMFMHERDVWPPLMQIGLIHGQFETIHPFLDGNGRMGRMLITLWLLERKVLRAPLLYLAAFFKRNQQEYYDRLQGLRESAGWPLWLEFFLDGVRQVASEASIQAREIAALRQAHEALIRKRLVRRATHALKLLDLLFKLPVVEGKKVQKALRVSQPTASSLLNSLGDLGILEEITGRQRGRVFAYRAYLDLFPGSELRS